MITSQHIAIYLSYRGDRQEFARAATESEKALIDEKLWALIEGLLEDIALIKNGLASEDYAEDVERRLEIICHSPEVIAEMRSIVDKGPLG